MKGVFAFAIASALEPSPMPQPSSIMSATFLFIPQFDLKNASARCVVTERNAAPVFFRKVFHNIQAQARAFGFACFFISDAVEFLEHRFFFFPGNSAPLVGNT